jgi:ribonucleoside-triphosphate reductase
VLPTTHTMSTQRFQLDPAFVASYTTQKPPFGFNGLGELVYLRTYSRLTANGTNEVWYETVQRVVEGTYNMQKRWILANGLHWNERKAQRSAQEMYERIFTMKFLPPGRGLWAMGSPLTEERELYAALNNCAFVSTANLATDLSEPFTFLMDASMLGIGVGFDTKGAGQLTIHRPVAAFGPDGMVRATVYAVPDTREGWVTSLEYLLRSYFTPDQAPVLFDYSAIRPAGAPITGFGGVASGPEPLRRMHERIRDVLHELDGQAITVTAIVDIMNLIGACVVAGNVRRTAEIAFGEHDSLEFMDLKNPGVNPVRNDPQTGWGWTSNNSIFAQVGQDYHAAAARVAINGEPGFAWLDNMREFGRLGDAPDGRDWRVAGGNPCLEQSLESYELCCLVETFPERHDSYTDYERTLKFAYLYAKTVTLGKTPWARTNAVMLRNRRIGLSMGGVVQAIDKFGIETFREWCEDGYETVQYYDEKYSDWLALPRSIKTTSIKPGGTVPLLPGQLPGAHWPEARHYIRRMRLSKYSELVPPLLEAGYHVEPCLGDDSSVVVSFPVALAGNLRTLKEVSMWEQLALAAFMQRHWADNQVSYTVTFNPATEGPQIAQALQYYQYQLKGISFLPRPDLFDADAQAPYPQMPYETITEARYLEEVANLTPIRFGQTHEEADTEKYCDSDHCVI